MELKKYSIGIGDRFAHQGKAQLQALLMAKKQGIEIEPVWNKSHREHIIISTSPEDVRKEADEAVKAVGWNDSYHVDADHIGLNNVDIFTDSSDFFTIDVADFIGSAAPESEVLAFAGKQKKYANQLSIPNITTTFEIPIGRIAEIARKYLLAVKQAGKIYRYIESAKGAANFITEVSMDESDELQTPVEMFFILAAIAEEEIPIQTIAPKFTGRFNKGVDYIGDVDRFAKEFDENLAVIAFAIEEFGLPENLKLSIHSGSDKFSIYGCINKTIKKYDAGIHLKTAGTTWLEELIGLAAADGEGLEIAKEIYRSAFNRFEELCSPYAAVIDIDLDNLPSPDDVEVWNGKQYADTLRHNPSCRDYNLNFRQLLHVGYKIAAEMGERYLEALVKYEDIIAWNVTENIYERHLKRLFF